MEVWKKIPVWFTLDNYTDLANFNAPEWFTEVVGRQHFLTALTHPELFINQVPPIDRANQIVEHIKTSGLLKRLKPLKAPTADRLFPEDEKMKRVAVKDLNELIAYEFLYGSEMKDEIEHDLAILDDWENGALLDRWEERKVIVQKYSGTLANSLRYRWEEGHQQFLEVDLDATDEQILFEFENWLVEKRSQRQYVKRRFSDKDFKDWASSRLLPYWDLVSIAALENATIPFHVLGEALFPDEFGVDLTERVRKVTKRKCERLFSLDVFLALEFQSQSVDTRNIS